MSSYEVQFFCQLKAISCFQWIDEEGLFQQIFTVFIWKHFKIIPLISYCSGALLSYIFQRYLYQFVWLKKMESSRFWMASAQDIGNGLQFVSRHWNYSSADIRHHLHLFEEVLVHGVNLYLIKITAGFPSNVEFDIEKWSKMLLFEALFSHFNVK